LNSAVPEGERESVCEREIEASKTVLRLLRRNTAYSGSRSGVGDSLDIDRMCGQWTASEEGSYREGSYLRLIGFCITQL